MSCFLFYQEVDVRRFFLHSASVLIIPLNDDSLRVDSPEKLKKTPKRLLSRLHDVDTFRVEVMTAGTQPTVNCEPAS